MEQKKAKMDYKVLTEKISPDNVAVMAELIAMRETRALIGYMGYHAEKAHKGFAGISSGKTSPDISFQTVMTSSKAWRYSYAVITESIWTTSCISPKEANRER